MDYEKLLNNYQVYFEGLPAPVFYKYFYPAWNPRWEENNTLREVFFYIRGLKKDKDDDHQNYRKYSNFVDKSTGEIYNLYERDLRDFLNVVWSATVHNRNTGIATIPSSKTEKTNRVTELVRRILRSRTGIFKDLTNNIHRAYDKQESHGGGSRDVEQNISTLDIRRPYEINNLDFVVVIDDIITTSNSFRAITELLRRNGFRGQIINFAFARHYPSLVAETYLKYAHDIRYEAFANTKVSREAFPAKSLRQSDDARINGVIYDLDQTLLDDAIRDVEFENDMESYWRRFPYQVYDGVEELTSFPIESAVVSNRSEWQLDKLFHNREVYSGIHFPEWARSYNPPVFSFPQATETDSYGNERKKRLYKPHPGSVKLEGGVLYAIHEILADQGLNSGRIVGLGNTREDIIAYKAAGAEAALALWGVPDWLKRHAATNWDADHVFDSVHEFREWLKTRIASPDYIELGRQCEEENPKRALEYYMKAMQVEELAGTAAFRYAYLISNKNPEKAKQLYRTAIAAGDEYAATNNLALLIQDEEPERAAALFERAIAAGDEVKATRNLAVLIWRSNPDRAIQLLRQAANAGNDSLLETDLKPMIEAGVQGAITLFEEYVISKDEKKAADLGRLLSEANPIKAEELFERAIAAGDEFGATFSLAYLVSDTDPERAKRLYERSIAAGDERFATNNLAQLIREDDKERARELYNRAIAAGNDYYAPRNLALLIKDDEPEEALDLLCKAARAGNVAFLSDDLDSYIQEGNSKALKLFEEEVIKRDGQKANILAIKIQGTDPEKAKQLYRTAIAAGDEYAATNNLALMIAKEDPKQAESLYRRAITAGDEEHATKNLAFLIEDENPSEAEELYRRSIAANHDYNTVNQLAVLVSRRDLSEGMELFLQAIEAGDDWCAPCNLAHLLISEDPVKARELYEFALKHEEPEAYLGLAYLLRKDDPEKAESYLADISDNPNKDDALKFFISFVALEDRETAVKAGRYFYKQGYEAAKKEILKVYLGDAYNATNDIVTFGKDPNSSKAIRWNVLKTKKKSVLLVSEATVATMEFTESKTSADWDNSLVRAWLNGDFLNDAFNPVESSKIELHQGAEDKVFCLTQDEAEQYLESTEESNLMKCKNIKTNMPSKWWLKPQGKATMSVSYVNEKGTVNWSIAFATMGVRPALWLKLEL